MIAVKVFVFAVIALGFVVIGWSVVSDLAKWPGWRGRR